MAVETEEDALVAAPGSYQQSLPSGRTAAASGIFRPWLKEEGISE